MAFCEYGWQALIEASQTAQEKSLEPENKGKKIYVQRKCAHPQGCPMIFDATFQDGNALGGGILSGTPCKTTGGRPN